MTRPRWEVADVFREYGTAYRAQHPESLSPEQSRAMRAISSCRTAVLGGHVDGCADCGHRRISYNSCRNRHCPKCQSLESRRWLEKMEADLLPIRYFHVVFTLPEELAPIALQNKRVLYNLLFATVNATLRKISSDPKHLGAEIGYLAVLHTWGQQLQHHPHLHCLVTGGGLALDGSGWKHCRKRFFLPVRVLSRLFRRLFLEGLTSAYRKRKLGFHGRVAELNEPHLFAGLTEQLRQKRWVVYAKPPFGSPEKVLNYLGRYTHRVAISNDRIVNMEEGRVSFRWKDYRHQNQRRVTTITVEEFIRRYMLHVLPRGFQRIRHFGLLSNRRGRPKLERARRLLKCGERKQIAAGGDYRRQYERLTGRSLSECPECGSIRWGRIEVIPRSSAAGWDSS